MNIEFIKDNMKKRGNETAVISQNKQYTYRQIYEEYERSVDFLEREQVDSGKIVALLADFTPVSIALTLAMIEKNIILVPISKTIKTIDSYLEISETEVFIDVTGEEIKVKRYAVEPAHEMLLELKRRNAPGLILFSSGTTGEPKAALHDLTFLMEKFKKKGKVLKTLTFLLFDHIGGFNTMMHALANGGTIVTLQTRSEEEVCRLIEQYRIELLPTSPTFLNMILLSHAYEKYDLSSLKIISYGTEPMPETTLKRIHAIFPEVRLKQTYGLSEVGIMATKSESSESLWLKLGGDGYETKIEDDILYIKAKSAMMGYLNAPSPFDEEGWFNTKDKVLVKGDYIKILGRTTDLINVGGEKVYPVEIESVLLEMLGVLDARVFGTDNPLTGKMIVAELLVDSCNNNRDFIKKARSYCRDKLERFKIPAKFILTTESLHGNRFKKKR